MDERLQFVARRLAGEPMAELCREFGISRKGNYPAVDSTPDVRERAAGNCLFMGTFTPARGPERRAIREAPGEPRRFLSAVRRAGSSRAIFARQLRSTKLKAGPSRVRRILSTLVFRP